MLDNGAIAELLTQEAEEAEGHWKFALKRAVKFALMSSRRDFACR